MLNISSGYGVALRAHRRAHIWRKPRKLLQHILGPKVTTRRPSCAAGVSLTLYGATQSDLAAYLSFYLGWFFLVLFLLLIIAVVAWVLYTRQQAKRQGLGAPHWKTYIPFLKSPTSNTNYPSPRHGSPLEWIKDQLSKLRAGRTARGAYEEAGAGADTRYGGPSGAGARGGRGRGLEDDAWDIRVGNEDPYGPGPGGYYEEQELGLAPTPGLHNEPYGGGSDYMSAASGPIRPSGGVGGGAYIAPPIDETGRGRSKSREPVAVAGGSTLDPNPFGDQHEAASLRSVSPRPVVDTTMGGTSAGGPAHTKGATSLDSQASNTSPISRKSMFREGL